jgi:hypothetical protein
VTTDTSPQARGQTDRHEGSGGPRAQGARNIGGELPRVPRRYGQWAGAVLFVLVAVLIAGWLWQQKSDRIEVLAVRHPIAAGSVIEESDLEFVEVAGVAGSLPSSDIASVAGSTAAVGLVEGQVLTQDMITADPVPVPGERVVGFELDASRTPGGLVPGDAVVVLAAPPQGDPSTPEQLDHPEVLADEARIASVELVEGSGTRLTLVLTQDVADRVTAYAAAGRVALVQAPIGGDD